MEILESRIKSTAIQSFAISALSVLLGLGLLAGGAVQVIRGGLDSGGFIALMGLAFLGIAWALSSVGRDLWPARSSVLYRIFEGEPQRLAWAYAKVGKTNGVKICLDNGHEYTLYANGRDSQALLDLVQRSAPQAILGYGAEQRRLYEQRRKGG